MTPEIARVVRGPDRWAVTQADALEFVRGLDPDTVDLLLTSPPYETSRTYSLGRSLPSGQEWVDWMVEFVRAAAPAVRGLIAVVCEGQTRQYRYSCTPFLLVADLHRAGFNLRKPPVYQRVGIPGSGGPDWLRNDWESIVCVTRPGRLPWSDNVACGRPPKYRQGGECSHRTKDGRRVTQLRREIGRRSASGERGKGRYVCPAVANPGNVIRCVAAGGHMGHKLCHENEAPFALSLAEFFVRSFCPPGGLVIDPFAGSSSTGHAALVHGRRYIGCDLRQSQVELSRRRIADVLATLEAAHAPQPTPPAEGRPGDDG